jgi:hypothetical protein
MANSEDLEGPFQTRTRRRNPFSLLTLLIRKSLPALLWPSLCQFLRELVGLQHQSVHGSILIPKLRLLVVVVAVALLSISFLSCPLPNASPWVECGPDCSAFSGGREFGDGSDSTFVFEISYR